MEGMWLVMISVILMVMFVVTLEKVADSRAQLGPFSHGISQHFRLAFCSSLILHYHDVHSVECIEHCSCAFQNTRVCGIGEWSPKINFGCCRAAEGF